jgi:hypothetical protein
MFMLLGLKCNEVLPVIQTEEATNNSKNMVSHKSRKSEQKSVQITPLLDKNT